MRFPGLHLLLALGLVATPAAARHLVFLEDVPTFGSALATVSGDRAAARRLLEENAARAAARVLGDLPALAEAAVVHRSWLANALVLDADPATVARLRRHPGVRRVVENRPLRLDPPRELAADQAPGDLPDRTWGLAALGVLEARAEHDVSGAGVVVGILDSGIDPTHPDLAGRTLAWKDLVEDRPEPLDENGHGSHCAGTIAGGASSGRAIGVAPGARLVVGRIFGKSGFSQADWILAGMQWIADPDGVPGTGDEPRLVSNSWGGAPGREIFREAVRGWRALGILPVFAAGNSGPREATVGSPAGFPESFAVGATTVEDGVADFSSRGPGFYDNREVAKPQVAAPGAAVTSAKVGGGYKVLSGTSMATPHVAGLAALLLEADPDLSAAQVEEILAATSAERGPPGHDPGFGAGLVDARAAVATARRGGRLGGRVVAEDGTPLPFAIVELPELARTLPLDDAGVFEGVLAAGTHPVAVRAFGYGPLVTTVEVAVGATAALDVVLARAPSGRVALALRDPENRPVAGEVTVRGAARPAFRVDGEADLVLPAGTWDLRVDAFGFASAELGEVEVAPGGQERREVALARLPGILLVDDDGGAALEPWFTAALDALELGYDMVDRADAPAGFTARHLTQYRTVIWFTGRDGQRVLERADMKALGGYLEAGGRLFLTGQEVGFKHGDSFFFRHHLRARFLDDGTTYKTVTGAGLRFSLVGGDGADNQWFPDEVEAREGAETYLVYGDGAGAAVRYADGGTRVVYLGFGLEGADSATARRDLLADALAFLHPGAATPRALTRARRFR